MYIAIFSIDFLGVLGAVVVVGEEEEGGGGGGGGGGNVLHFSVCFFPLLHSAGFIQTLERQRQHAVLFSHYTSLSEGGVGGWGVVRAEISYSKWRRNNTDGGRAAGGGGRRGGGGQD